MIEFAHLRASLYIFLFQIQQQLSTFHTRFHTRLHHMTYSLITFEWADVLSAIGKMGVGQMFKFSCEYLRFHITVIMASFSLNWSSRKVFSNLERFGSKLYQIRCFSRRVRNIVYISSSAKLDWFSWPLHYASTVFSYEDANAGRSNYWWSSRSSNPKIDCLVFSPFKHGFTSHCFHW